MRRTIQRGEFLRLGGAGLAGATLLVSRAAAGARSGSDRSPTGATSRGQRPQGYFKQNIEKPFEKANQGTDLKVTFQPPDEMDRLVRTALQGGEGPTS